MKNIFISGVMITLLASCNLSDEDLTKANLERDSMLRERDSVLSIAEDREETINQFVVSFNEIERNLDSITAKQQIIYTGSEAHILKLDQKNRINSQISSINRLMKENTETISKLKRRLSKANFTNKNLEETITTLNNQLSQKNVELGLLNERLNSLDLQVAQLQISIDTLTGQNRAKSAIIEENTVTMHTAYYVIGKTKELQEAKLIDTKGGLLGIGRTPKLSENFDKNKFVRIDYTQTASIPINSDGVKIITTHPADSYILDKDGQDKKLVKNIVITNPEKFWSASKYLVIVIG
jgi:hypothetical protein